MNGTTATVVELPRLTESMEQATLVLWLAADGHAVGEGDPLAEIETDKATDVLRAPTSGVLHHRIREGATIPVGTPIAEIAAAHTPAPPADTSPPRGADGRGDGASPPAPSPADRSATPLARRLADRHGIDLASISAGDGGHVTRADVERALGVVPALRAAPDEPAASPGDARRVPMNRMQLTIARRMAEATATAPHFSVSRDVDVTELLAFRARFAEQVPAERVTVNALVVRAVGLAVAEAPERVRQFDGDAFLVPERAHVGVAVALEDGLMVPVVRDADRLGVVAIARRTAELTERCRTGTIGAADLEGGAVTVSNLGMFGIDRFVAILNLPQSAILAVGRARPTAVPDGDGFVRRELMSLTLSVDHRAVNGAEAAGLLAGVADRLERPYTLIS